MGESKGWICLHRSITDNLLWDDKPFAYGQAWIDLLLLANHEKKKFLLGAESVTVESGSFITSELKLMDRWGWSKTKVRNFLQLLINEGMIEKKADKKKTAITIVKWGAFQDFQTTEKPQKDHKETTKRPQKDTNNNDNNDKQCKQINIKHKYGMYKNVLLTDEELQKLKSEFSDWENRIEVLSEYLEMKGDKYKSHLATIRKWAKNEKKGVSADVKAEQRRDYMQFEDLFNQGQQCMS